MRVKLSSPRDDNDFVFVHLSFKGPLQNQEDIQRLGPKTKARCTLPFFPFDSPLLVGNIPNPRIHPQGWIREEGGAVVDDITVGLVHIGKDICLWAQDAKCAIACFEGFCLQSLALGYLTA